MRRIIGLFILFSFFAAGAFDDPKIVEFIIPKGTLGKDWNTNETPIEAKVGDTIRFINQDSIIHQLHTYDGICEHGPEIEPGSAWDCLIIGAWDTSDINDPPLYDHNTGGKVFVRVVP